MRKDQTCGQVYVSRFLSICLVFLGATLNQSSLFLGINFSLADIMLFVVATSLLLRKMLFLPLKPLIFFLVVSISVLFTSFFIVPELFSFNPSPIRILNGYIKLLALLVYFIVGYNLARINLAKNVLESFSTTAIYIGAISLLPFVFGKRFGFMYHGNSIRFQGLMIDPNYFSVLQCCACAYIFLKRKGNFQKIALSFLILSILMSGSKTGVIVLCTYFLIKIIELFLSRKYRLGIALICLAIGIAVVTIMPVLVREWKNILNIISDIIPPFRRIAVLFTDFRIAFSEAGSGRDVTWETAMRLIRISPIFGIGIGTYTGITALEWGVRSIAHNTYLQMAAEWGLPLAVLFFAVVVWLLIQSSREIYNFEIVKISIDIILVFLLGSLALSLNNARMFWFTLGLLFFYQSKQRKVAVA